MKRRDGGYVLVYVVVVIVILCILIPAASSNSLKNLKAQQASIERTRQLYTAEGQIEKYTAELKAGAEAIRGSDADEAKAAFAGIAFDIAAGMQDSRLENGEDRENFQPAWETDENGNYLCGLSLVSTAGDVTVSAGIQVELEIREASEADEKTACKVTRCTITYSSYDISATEGPENTGEEGGTP